GASTGGRPMKQLGKRLPLPSVRRGVSLIELIITIGVSGVILTMGLGTLHLLLRTDDNLHLSLKHRQTVAQLSDAFRRDTHSAREVKQISQPDAKGVKGLELQLAADHQVQYTAQNHILIRTETQNQETLQTARFRFSPGTEILFESDSANSIAIVLRNYRTNPDSPRTTDPRTPERELTIQAVPGRDHRFEKTTTP
ncbi:MAG: prepilin-type N-terminal cleavage/methylation domain-containing protein, partial [Planctomycetaceae bacterium]|nr:prepilin-type N-terminal cleavage/methylation domain-containing protein [Planctomycetaceae bacterium]